MPRTIFIDLDGTLVKHNYSPLVTQDSFLPGAVDFLRHARSAGHYCILTTNRSAEKSEAVLKELLTHYNFSFERVMFDLPVGVRILINDTKGTEVRAIAVPVLRDVGLEDISL